MEDKSLAINNMPRTQANVLKRGAAYAELVVRTAKIKCNCGDGHDVINLPLDHAVYSGTTPLVTIKDMVVDTNICNGFGVCSTPDGQKLECKKEIIITHEWVNKQELRTRINGVEALSTDAWTICGKHGGVITIENSGQSAKYGPNANAETTIEKNVNNMEENADTNLGEGTGVKIPTLEECDIAIAMLGKLWFEAGPAEREKLHREADLLREYKGYIGKSVPLSDEFKASVEACFAGGNDPLKTGITSLDTKVMSIDELQIIALKNKIDPIKKISPVEEMIPGKYIDDGFRTIGQGFAINATVAGAAGEFMFIYYDSKKINTEIAALYEDIYYKADEEPFDKPFIYWSGGVELSADKMIKNYGESCKALFYNTKLPSLKKLKDFKNLKKLLASGGISLVEIRVDKKYHTFDPEDIETVKFNGGGGSALIFSVDKLISDEEKIKMVKAGLSTPSLDIRTSIGKTIMFNKSESDQMLDNLFKNYELERR